MAAVADDLIQPPPNRPILLRNRNCIYCGKLFDDNLEPTKEHVVGRRFVPRGCFDGQWNLIANACAECNGAKADLEDDISAISMQPDAQGRYVIEDPRLAAEAMRKAANARSRRTAKKIAESHEEVKIERHVGAAKFTFTFSAPPQVEDDRVFRLAHYHFRGFFYYITYQEGTRVGGFVPGDFCPLMSARRADWGNPRLRWFMTLVGDWDLRVFGVAADTFFKVLIRRHPDGKDVWAWAVEWNHNIRVVGFAGSTAPIRDLIINLPDSTMEVAHDAPGEWMGMSISVPLAEQDDDLFQVLLLDSGELPD